MQAYDYKNHSQSCSGTNNQSNFKPKLTIFSSYCIPAYYNVRVQNQVQRVTKLKDLAIRRLKFGHYIAVHESHFEIDCQIIG